MLEKEQTVLVSSSRQAGGHLRRHLVYFKFIHNIRSILIDAGYPNDEGVLYMVTYLFLSPGLERTFYSDLGFVDFGHVNRKVG